MLMLIYCVDSIPVLFQSVALLCFLFLSNFELLYVNSMFVVFQRGKKKEYVAKQI